MKTFCCRLLAILFSATAQAQTPASTPQETKPIPFADLGVTATADYKGDALGITASAYGARLHTGFQKLAGTVTREGLRLDSTEAEGGGLTLTASSIGRNDALQPSSFTLLPFVGTVSIEEKLVRWTRPGMVEEYSVSADGVRQDFIVTTAPAGTGELSVELALSGARAEALGEGVKLTLTSSGRELAYARLRVADATGRSLTAHLHVLAPERLAVRVQDAGAVYPIRIDPTFSDADWVSLNPSISGTNTNWNGYAGVLAMVVDSSGNLYIGGSFSVIVNVAANGIAKWNGSEWSTLGTGMNSYVNTLTVSGNDLYAGGNFTTAGGTPANRIAKWNGSEWSTLRRGINGRVKALAVIGSTLYAGGLFTTADLETAKGIAKWTGTQWLALGEGMIKNHNFIELAAVNALAVIGNDLYAGGSFRSAGGTAAKYIAKWNGTAWSALGDGMDNDVNALAVIGNELYAGGSFTTAGGTAGGPPANHIAKWNGSEWSALVTDMNDVGMNSYVSALAVIGNDLYAGGFFTTAGGVAANGIAKWNGNAWSAFGSGLDATVNALAVSGNDLYAGGYFTMAGGTPANRIAKWNGSVWSPLGSGLDGTVNALAVIGNDLYAGGVFTNAGGTSANRIAKWNGSVWSPLGSGMNDGVSALAVSGNDLYAGGDFTTAGGGRAYYMAQWNGNGWSGLSAGMNNGVYALAVNGNDLYAGGYFTLAGGRPANRIAKWNGSTWSALGMGMNDGVYALAVSGNDLYAGGYFNTAGDGAANRIAKWNGSAWSALGMGMNDNVNALTIDRTGHLYLGGVFTVVGTIVSPFIAQANITFPTVTAIYPTSGTTLGGTNVTITGTNLSGASAVTIGGVAATNVVVVDSTRITATTPANTQGTASVLATTPDGTNVANMLYTYVMPDIAVTHASPLIDGADSVQFGATLGVKNEPLTFAITNTGSADLTSLEVTKDGPDAALFSVSSISATSIPVGSGTSIFTVTFSPKSGGVKTAALHIASNVNGAKNPFDIAITGTGRNASQAAQTLFFTPPSKLYLAESSFTLTASSSSGLPVVYTVLSGPANVSGNVLNLTGAGTVKLRATQTGNADYLAATPVERTITVAANPTTLTLTNLSQIYAGTPRPITVLGATGAADVTYKIGLNYVSEAPINVGSYPVKAVVVGSSAKTGTLIISKAPLFVQPDDQRKFAGQVNPVLGFGYRGFLGGDIAVNSVSKAPVIATTATATSPGGLYPITASLGTAANYIFVYLSGTMKVESFAGNYEALLVDGDPIPVGKLSITVAATSKTFTAKLATATETSVVSFVSSNLITVGEQATGTATTLVGTGKIPYRIDFTLPTSGNVTASATRSSLPLGSAADGRKLSTATVAYAGAHTAVLEPATPTGSTVPAGAGWATARISTTGVITLTGKLGDGTGFTSALSPDDLSNPGYRLFVQPYITARTHSFLAGSFTLAEHPIPGRRYLAQSSLTWKKTKLDTDSSYRTTFGTVNTVLMIDPWLEPKTTVPTFTLAQRLGLTGTSFGVSHSATGSASQSSLPTRLALSTANAVSVLTPAANLTKWKTLTFVPKTGTITGSFELTDAIKRTVTFSGILRQPATLPDTLIGEGHYLLPPLVGTEKTTGEVMFTRP